MIFFTSFPSQQSLLDVLSRNKNLVCIKTDPEVGEKHQRSHSIVILTVEDPHLLCDAVPAKVVVEIGAPIDASASLDT